MRSQHKKFIISLLIGTSFSVYGSGKINANDDDVSAHTQANTALHPQATVGQHNQAVADRPMTIEEFAETVTESTNNRLRLSGINKSINLEDFKKAIARSVSNRMLDPATIISKIAECLSSLPKAEIEKMNKYYIVSLVCQTSAINKAFVTQKFLTDLNEVFANKGVQDLLDFDTDSMLLGNNVAEDNKIAPQRLTHRFADIVSSLLEPDIHLDYDLVTLLNEVNIADLKGLITKQLVTATNELAAGFINRKSTIFEYLSNVIPEKITPEFIATARFIMQSSGEGSTSIIKVLGMMNSEYYQNLENFFRANPRYSQYVPSEEFCNEMVGAIYNDSGSWEAISSALTRLHNYFYNNAPQGTPQNLAFEIHNYANQVVTDANTGATGKFNDVVLNKVQERNAKNKFIILNFEDATALMQKTMETMLAEDASSTATGAKAHYSDALNADVLNWVVSCQGDANDQMVLKQVVTFLQPTPEKLETWLAAFMAESKDAYRGRNNPESCVKGVKERVITSLRNVFADDVDFQSIFAQAEAPKLLQAKLATLGNFDVWAKRLFDAGARSTTPEPDAKRIYEQVLKDYFSDVTNESNKQEIDQNIRITLDTFDDSITEVSGKEIHEKGAWNNMFKDLLREHEAENNAGAANATGNSSMGASGEAN